MLSTLCHQLEESGFVFSFDQRAQSRFRGVLEEFAWECALGVALREETASNVPLSPAVWELLERRYRQLSGEFHGSDDGLASTLLSMLGGLGKTFWTVNQRIKPGHRLTQGQLQQLHSSARMLAMGSRGGQILRDAAIVLIVSACTSSAWTVSSASYGALHYRMLESAIRMSEEESGSSVFRLGPPSFLAASHDADGTNPHEGLEQLLEKEKQAQRGILVSLCEKQRTLGADLLGLLVLRKQSMEQGLSGWSETLEDALFDGI